MTGQMPWWHVGHARDRAAGLSPLQERAGGRGAAARSSPAHRAASPGREMERDRLKAEPEARGQRAARLCHSGCTARPFRLGLLHPLCPWCKARSRRKENPGGVLQRPWRLYLLLPAPGDEIHPENTSGTSNTLLLPRPHRHLQPLAGDRAGGTRWLGALSCSWHTGTSREPPGTPLVLVERRQAPCQAARRAVRCPPGRKQRLPGDGEQSQALRPRSAGAAFGLHCSPRAEETARSQPGPFPGQRRPVCVRARPHKSLRRESPSGQISCHPATATPRLHQLR